MKFLIALLLFSQLSSAQTYSSDPADSIASRVDPAGYLITIRFVRGKPVRIYALGKEEVKLDFSQLKFVVKRLSSNPQRFYKLTSSENYFEINEDINWETNYGEQNEKK